MCGSLAGVRNFNASSPFELEDFHGDTAAQAISDDFASLSDHAAMWRSRHGPAIKLCGIDQRPTPTQLAQDENVVLLHAPPPKNYPWFDALGSATPEGMEYEQRVLAPVIEIVKRMALEAEDAPAMSGA